MSAPFIETWWFIGDEVICPAPPGYRPSEDYIKDIEASGKTKMVKFLRADLTCGECKNWEKRYSRGKALAPIGDCAQFDDHYSAQRIACMAFVPREEKR